MFKIIRRDVHTLLLPTSCWIGGIVVASKVGFPYLLYFGILALFLTALVVKKVRFYSILLISFMLGWSFYSNQLQPQIDDIEYHLLDLEKIDEVFEYNITSQHLSKAENVYYTIKLEKMGDYSFNGDVLAYGLPDSLSLNTTYKTALSITAISPPKNPQEFNFKDYYASKGISGRAFPLGRTKLIRENRPTFPARIKQQTRTKIENLFKHNRGIALAIFLGDKEFFNLDSQTLARSGVLHLFAVSGLHVGLIYITLLIIFNIFLKLKYARFSASLLLILYAYLCNWSPSVSRTVIILLLYNSAILLQRQISFAQMISATLLIITALNPATLFSPGLHLSLTAFSALWIADRHIMPLIITKIGNTKMGKIVKPPLTYLFFSSSVIVTIAPISALYFHTISFNALLTNIVATPLISLMLNLELFLIMIPQSWLISEKLINLYHLLVFLFLKLIDWFSLLPLYIDNFSLNKVEFIILILIVVTAIALFQIKKRLVFPVTALLFTAYILLFFTNLTPKHFEVICFASGKADCSFIQFKEGENLLIDTGSQEQNYNVVKSALLPYLAEKHIRTINHLIITHAHEDHYGGLPLLAKNLKIEKIYLTDESLKTPEIMKVLEGLTTFTQIITITDTTSFLNTQVKIIHPDKNFYNENPNNLSIVTKITSNSKSYLFTGDIEREAEDYLLKNYPQELSSHFLKIPHHGSNTSSTLQFLQQVKPEIAFIPTDLHNKFNLPHPKVINRLDSLKIKYTISGRDGAMILRP